MTPEHNCSVSHLYCLGNDKCYGKEISPMMSYKKWLCKKLGDPLDRVTRAGSAGAESEGVDGSQQSRELEGAGCSGKWLAGGQEQCPLTGMGWMGRILEAEARSWILFWAHWKAICVLSWEDTRFDLCFRGYCQNYTRKGSWKEIAGYLFVHFVIRCQIQDFEFYKKLSYCFSLSLVLSKHI
jgi:hypothetical protein